MGRAEMNAFLETADRQQVAASKRRDKFIERSLAKLVVKSDADAPMVASPSDKAAFERQAQLKHYRAFIAERRANLLQGKYRSEVSELLKILDTLAVVSASGLISFLAKCQWFLHADRTTRQDILSLISTGIARHRVQQGLAPFDDSIFDEPPTAFEIIRSNMQVFQ
jgi:hypothetical protein